MSSSAIVGLQWGDEGKGKITDLLAKKSDYIIRYQGGNNAGHSLNIKDKTFVLHLIPSGVIHPGKKCIIGPGVVINPKALIEELENLKKNKIDNSHVFIAQRAHLSMPYHLLLDEYKEEFLGKNLIGTTKRGIGPTYEDKIARVGIRVIDLLDKEILRKKIKKNTEDKNEIITKIYKKPALKFEEIYQEYLNYSQILTPRILNAVEEIHNALKRRKKILFEGAQALLLDIDYGTYPFVTTSSASTAGACTGSGIPPTALKNLIGVTKAYCTRVGSGPFPTELNTPEGEELREKGHEYGATTKRTRRCGWLDLVALRYACQINGINKLVLTKLDVLSGFKTLKICIAYKTLEGKIIKNFPASTELLSTLKPIYEEFSGWQENIYGIKNYEDLPKNCKNYISYIEDQLGLKMNLISTGPQRDQNILKEKNFF